MVASFEYDIMRMCLSMLVPVVGVLQFAAT